VSLPARALETRWFGLSLLRHPRVDGGPLVWTILLRLGSKKRLP
jgi:hypothetical protein